MVSGTSLFSKKIKIIKKRILKKISPKTYPLDPQHCRTLWTGSEFFCGSLSGILFVLSLPDPLY
jgi:hypothetical protein